ncbi:MAG: Brp/Blh family beta-carotene 15,15'-dioxygenase [Bacteroidota bacterium]
MASLLTPQFPALPISSGPSLASLWIGWIPLGLVLALTLGGLTWTTAWIYLPLFASGVLFGMPHGALDHIVLLQQRQASFTASALGRVLLPYLALMGVYALAWWLFPLAAFVFFILMTWFHWGQGDVQAQIMLVPETHLQSRGLRVLTLIVRGGFPMLVPLLAFPEVYGEVGAAVMAVTEPEASAAFIPSAEVRSILAVAFGGLVLTQLAWGAMYGWLSNRMAWLIDAGETVLLALFFAFIHPVLAIGVYFCCWHALRHIVRLLKTDIGRPGPPPYAAIRARTIRRTALHAVPTTLAALLMVAGLYAWMPSDAAVDVAGIYLFIISVLTFPHVWVVCRMDRDEGIWHA